MALTVKKKIWLGTLFLFLLLLVMGGVGIFYMARLKNDAKNVLHDNYKSLIYCHTMQQKLNTLPQNFSGSLKGLRDALQQQQQNITEPGEQQATDSLRNEITKLQTGDTSRQNIRNIYGQIQAILYINMQAIKRKSEVAEASASDALTILISMGGLVFIIAFTFIVNFPSIITNPINQLTDAIKEISNKNYKYRIHIDNKDEFGNLADAYNNMAERLEYFESSNLNQILFEKTRAEAVINSLKDASIGIDKNNRVLFANAQALQLLGLGADQMVGKPVDDIKKMNDLFRFLVENESVTPFKIVVENRENYFTKEVLEVEQEDNKNKVIVLKNITSFKELDVAKTNFIATISHELKTPLASSDFSLKLLEDERVSKLSAEQKELIASLKGDNLRMLKILSELLNMSQVETGKIQVNLSAVNPAAIISTAIENVRSVAAEKGISIENNADGNVPGIEADADKTTWVLNNFLTNAIKYSSAGKTIEVGLHRHDGAVVFSVRDHGPGIPAEYLPRLFERYFQVPGSKEKGNGLGLTISKEFVEAQGGKIWAESQVGQGSLFSFELPVK